MENKKVRIISNVSLLICAMIWGIGFVATDAALKAGIGPYYVMTFRFFIAFVLLALIFFNKLRKATKRDIFAGIIIGIAMFAAFGFQTVGLQYTTPGKQSFLTGTYVVIVPFLYWMIIKKAPDRFQIIGTILCVAGTAFLTLDGNGFYLAKGDILTLVCAVFFALHIVLVDHYTRECDPIVLTILQMVVAGVLSLGFALFTKEPFPTDIPMSGYGAVFYLGAISTMVAYMIQNVSIKYTSSTEAAIILCLETVFGSLFSVILLGEKFTVNMVIGCVIIFVALVTAETKLSFIFKPKETMEKDMAENREV
ncbi:Permease of the drug/metabolite transporter (DMT) superfamily [Hathewaya proteolytica DSM 3090]|uniref:Permease of the drug/metabolite transporter (DMT) superfamily n=1 Tax=Hathewaya proteolytica DSM 3090 TaxID=1121331 RepID=A0A1M6PGY1_9CLOT|nr:DMT family transporter [Hathewaya proteolytica]SHK07150.1 Permease of the drug/metabolite transporter (DMT) superfamily [Hathewaya proteolytica DSM 3090]